jgi:hypothetical protein
MRLGCQLPWEGSLRIFIRAPLPELELCPKQSEHHKGKYWHFTIKHRYFTWVRSSFGLESLLRVNEAELKYSLWAKRCAPQAHRLWAKGAI